MIEIMDGRRSAWQAQAVVAAILLRKSTMAPNVKKILASNGTANGLLAVTCVAVLWTAVASRPSAPVARAVENVWPANTAAPVVLSGDAAPPARSVVLFLHSGCRYCAEEMEFYRQLQELAEVRGVRLYAASVERDELLRAYLHANHLTGFNPLPGTSVPGLSATPTVLFVDERGLVQHSWRGVMSGDQKEELRRLL